MWQIQSNMIALFCFCRFKWHEQQYLGTFSSRPKFARYPSCPAFHREHVHRGVTSQTGSGGGAQGAETLGPQLETDGSGQSPSVFACVFMKGMGNCVHTEPYFTLLQNFFFCADVSQGFYCQKHM